MEMVNKIGQEVIFGFVFGSFVLRI
jgi:hypothetical protein